mmetsp:Transcript_38352/g.108405  ORF Transcript_38352/g.108405 Transcript_38352/m.108405 type:complete len:228 (+) Transcript_38352:721-1404(+)
MPSVSGGALRGGLHLQGDHRSDWRLLQCGPRRGPPAGADAASRTPSSLSLEGCCGPTGQDGVPAAQRRGRLRQRLHGCCCRAQVRRLHLPQVLLTRGRVALRVPRLRPHAGVLAAPRPLLPPSLPREGLSGGGGRLAAPFRVRRGPQPSPGLGGEAWPALLRLPGQATGGRRGAAWRGRRRGWRRGAVPQLPAPLLLRVRRLHPREPSQLPRLRVPAPSYRGSSCGY